VTSAPLTGQRPSVATKGRIHDRTQPVEIKSRKPLQTASVHTWNWKTAAQNVKAAYPESVIG